MGSQRLTIEELSAIMQRAEASCSTSGDVFALFEHLRALGDELRAFQAGNDDMRQSIDWYSKALGEARMELYRELRKGQGTSA